MARGDIDFPCSGLPEEGKDEEGVSSAEEEERDMVREGLEEGVEGGEEDSRVACREESFGWDLVSISSWNEKNDKDAEGGTGE